MSPTFGEFIFRAKWTVVVLLLAIVAKSVFIVLGLKFCPFQIDARWWLAWLIIISTYCVLAAIVQFLKFRRLVGVDFEEFRPYLTSVGVGMLFFWIVFVCMCEPCP